MKSRKTFSLIIFSIFLAGTISGCNEAGTERTVLNQNTKVKSATSNFVPNAIANTNSFKESAEILKAKSDVSTTLKAKLPVANSLITPVKKLKPAQLAKPFVNPISKPLIKELVDISAIRATCNLADGTSTLCPVLVTGVNIGDAKITSASEGLTQAEVDKLNYGLSEDRKLYTYWLSTGHDYDIFGNPAKEEVKNGWSNSMIEATDILRATSVNTAETKAAAREFQFIAQEIVNYQPYAIQAEGYTNWSSWDRSNSKQSVGSTMAMITFGNIEVDIKGKL